MTTVHSPKRTRSQTTTGIPYAEIATTTPKAEILRTILQELERLREKQKADDAAELRRLELQLNHSNNISATRDVAHEVGGGFASHEGSCMSGIGSVNAGIKFKPDTFDGAVPLREFLTQFNLIARINAWPDAVKAVELEREGACGS